MILGIRMVRFVYGKLRTCRRGEEGGTLVLVALAGTVLMASLGLTTDAGLVYLTRARLNATVDAAALAGVQQLPADPAGAQDVAREYAVLNGLTAEQVVVEVSDDQKTISVEGWRQAELFLGEILGQGDPVVTARAVAQAVPPGALRGAAPLAIENQQFQYGVLYTLKAGSGSETPLGPGNYGALSLGGMGASNYEENLRNGYQGLLQVGDQVATETGNMSNPTKRGINDRLSRCLDPLCSPTNFARDCPHVLLVPLYRHVEESEQQVKEVEVTGFAAFWVESVEGQGNESVINGYFVQTLAPGIAGPGQADTGVYIARLVG